MPCRVRGKGRIPKGAVLEVDLTALHIRFIALLAVVVVFVDG